MQDASSTAQRLLTCALSLILDRGYNAFSYADLAARVGISKASIHHHFPTKADLVATLLKQYRQQARALIARESPMLSSARSKLEAFVHYWAHCLKDGSQPICVAVLLAAELPSLPDAVSDQVRGHFIDLSGWLRTVFTDGLDAQTDGPAAAMAEGFMASIHGAMLSARAYGDATVFGMITQPILDNLPF